MNSRHSKNTVFVFFLLRAEGILFKDLPKYNKKLMDIYRMISNSTSLETIQRSVNDLANPYSNSMTEKCSRIREAFMKSIDKRLAEHYCVKVYILFMLTHHSGMLTHLRSRQ